MLILTRKSGQTIVIGGGIEVKILEIRGKQVRLGISAASDVPVYRGELFEAIQEENRRAAAGAKAGLSDLASRVKGGARGEE
ncbi:MAG: carbon storage regulator [Nitrospirae bacterium]|nr:MAG: carbon storage regulator [Nitrospirota bacterium]